MAKGDKNRVIHLIISGSSLCSSSVKYKTTNPKRANCKICKENYKRMQKEVGSAPKLGRPKAIKSPDQMLEYFKKYCMDTKNNPILRTDFKGKDAEKVHYDLEKPLSWIGFDVWLFHNVGLLSGVEHYRLNTDERYNDFSEVVRVISQIILEDQVNGAMVGTYKENLVARLNGFSEKSETKSEVTIKETKIGFD